MSDERSFREQLEQYADIVRRTGANSECAYCCFEDLVAKWGRDYRAQPLPGKYRRGLPKQCFDNARQLMYAHWGQLTYVEGYARLAEAPLPILHAWCVEVGSDLVIDPTSENLIDYVGIPFTRQYLADHEINSRTNSVIDDYDRGHPLMRMSEEELRQAIEQ